MPAHFLDWSIKELLPSYLEPEPILCIGHAVTTSKKSMSEDQPAAPWWPPASKNCATTPDPERAAWCYQGGTVQIPTSHVRCSL